MKRRAFITLLGGAAAWPIAARPQQAGRARRLGVLMGVSNNALGQARVKAFQQQLQKLGWIEGRNIAIEYRWGEGGTERYDEFAAEFVRLKVDVIVAEGTPPTLAAKNATSVIPIVFIGVGDPVLAGLVASLARPGGNATGLSNQARNLAGKRSLGILANVDNLSEVNEMRTVAAEAATLGLDVVKLEIRRAEEIASALQSLKGRTQAVYVVTGAFANANALRINTLALGQGLPTMYGSRQMLEFGGLISYGADILDLRRRAADYVDKILRGTKPGDIPVEQPTKFELVVNLKTAQAIGLTVPPTLTARADEVIE
jgi:putative tryptophan/tyrosine transport system substrate-binding protein